MRGCGQWIWPASAYWLTGVRRPRCWLRGSTKIYQREMNTQITASTLQSHHAAAYDARIKQKTLEKPDWIRVKAASGHSRFYEIKRILREHQLHTVCEEASCPNIGECFGKG